MKDHLDHEEDQERMFQPGSKLTRQMSLGMSLINSLQGLKDRHHKRQYKKFRIVMAEFRQFENIFMMRMLKFPKFIENG